MMPKGLRLVSITLPEGVATPARLGRHILCGEHADVRVSDDVTTVSVTPIGRFADGRVHVYSIIGVHMICDSGEARK